jgi:hypothetical protein
MQADCQPDAHRRRKMHRIIKAALAAACIVILAWPLFLSGKPAVSQHEARDAGRYDLPTYNMTPRHELVW